MVRYNFHIGGIVMDSVTLVFYILLLLIVGFTAYQIFKIKKAGKFDAQTYEQVKVLVYDVLNEAAELYKQKQTSKEAFIKGIISLIRHKIVESEQLSEADKNFWTEDKLQNLFMPVITVMMDRIDKQITK